MRKLPSIPPGSDQAAVSAISQTLQYITGQTTAALQPLPSAATTAQIITKINEIISRLQGT